jgi:hypothetical protein
MGVTFVIKKPNPDALQGHPLKDKILDSKDVSYLLGVQKAELSFGSPEVVEFLRLLITELRSKE